MSLQYHNYRSEHWIIVSGLAKVHVDGKEFMLKPGQSIDIPCKSHHYIENLETEDLENKLINFFKKYDPKFKDQEENQEDF